MADVLFIIIGFIGIVSCGAGLFLFAAAYEAWLYRAHKILLMLVSLGLALMAVCLFCGFIMYKIAS